MRNNAFDVGICLLSAWWERSMILHRVSKLGKCLLHNNISTTILTFTATFSSPGWCILDIILKLVQVCHISIYTILNLRQTPSEINWSCEKTLYVFEFFLRRNLSRWLVPTALLDWIKLYFCDKICDYIKYDIQTVILFIPDCIASAGETKRSPSYTIKVIGKSYFVCRPSALHTCSRFTLFFAPTVLDYSARIP